MAGRGRALSDLEAVLAEMIRRDGPLPVGRFMDLALNHPTCGYYRRRDPLGAQGDFVTAPELSQAFGEVIGAWLAQAWRDLGAPAPFRLVELGPGRGTLLADALRATRSVPGFHQSLRLHLVETSAADARRPGGSPDGLRRELARPVRRGAAGAHPPGRQRILRCPADAPTGRHGARVGRALRGPGHGRPADLPPRSAPFSPGRPPARGNPRHARGGQPGAQRAGTRHRPAHRG